MSSTKIRPSQISSVNRADIDVTTSGSALITKVIAGTNVTITSTGTDTGTGDVTINASGGGSGLSWTEVTGTSQTAAGNNAYIANNASLVTITLPASSNVGDQIVVVGKGAGGWKLAQNSGQSVQFVGGATTVGTGGSLVSGMTTDSLTIVCIVANTTWQVVNSTFAVTDQSGNSLDTSLIVDKFTSNGTWTKRPGAKMVRKILWGAGGGGGAGRRGAAATVRCGGGGGGAGGQTIVDYEASMMPSTESVTIGSGGTGGAAQTVDSTNGANGGLGGATIAGNERGAGGNSGTGGSTSGGAGGGAVNYAYQFVSVSSGGGASANSTGGVGSAPSSYPLKTAPGGSGGGITSGDTPNHGGDGGGITNAITSNAYGYNGSQGAINSNGTDGVSYSSQSSVPFAGGGGGGGGGASITGAGGNGGNGGAPGGGGGGGGASLNGNNSGAGGTGGRGEAWYITYF